MRLDYRALFSVAIYINAMVALGAVFTPGFGTPALIEKSAGIPVWCAGAVHLVGIPILLLGWRKPRPKRDTYFLLGTAPIGWYGLMTIVGFLLYGGGIGGIGLITGLWALLIMVYFWLNGHH